MNVVVSYDVLLGGKGLYVKYNYARDISEFG